MAQPTCTRRGPYRTRQKMPRSTLHNRLKRMQGSLVKEMESMLGKPVSISLIPIVSQLIHIPTIIRIYIYIYIYT